VAARTSSFSFKGKDVKIAQIAKELNVSHVLEGSVRKSGNRVRITAQLIKADDGFHLWSETYDRTLDDIFVVQDEIARKVVEALKVTLMGALPETRKTDPEVYSLYLQGRYFSNQKGKGDLEKAQLAYEQALAIDSQYAPAWIGISVVYQDQRKFSFRANDEANSLSMEAVEKALAIDNNMATAWASLAYLKRQEWDLDGAKIAIEKALQLEPNNALVLGTAATLAGTFGQLQTSIELFEKNVRLDPMGLSGHRALGTRYAYAGRYDESLESFNRVIAINPDYPYIHMTIGRTYLWKGDPETALIEIDKHRSAPRYDFHKVRILSAMGREAEAQIIINRLLKSSALQNPGVMGIVYAWRGENDLAFEWLEKDYLVRPANFSFFLINPWFKNLEGDPRYPVFLEKIGLLEYWKAMPRPDEEVKP